MKRGQTTYEYLTGKRSGGDRENPHKYSATETQSYECTIVGRSLCFGASQDAACLCVTSSVWACVFHMRDVQAGGLREVA
eukprot:967565-Amphidinium_carterae.2